MTGRPAPFARAAARAHPLRGVRRGDRRPVAPHQLHTVPGRLESEA